jgi:pSer/pThr/pTyr-binding forkhead associated (FHA) protein
VHPSGREFTWLPRTETLAGYIGRRALVGESLAEIELADIPHLEVVSRQHARIHWDATAQVYQITDEKSQNGTFLNGKPLTAGLPHPLHHEDWLQLGQHGLVRLQVQLAAH